MQQEKQKPNKKLYQDKKNQNMTTKYMDYYGTGKNYMIE